MTSACRHYDVSRYSTLCMETICILCVENTSESVFNFYANKSKCETFELCLKILILILFF